MSELDIKLELTKIGSIIPQSTDYEASAIISMTCTLTEECWRGLEKRILYSLRERNLTDTGIGRLDEYISHIGRREFNKQLAAMGYKTVLTEEKKDELFGIVERRNNYDRA